MPWSILLRPFCRFSSVPTCDKTRELCEAFGGAWEKIRQRYGEDQVLIGPARLKLAHAILAVATEDAINAEELKERVLDIVGR